MLLNYIMSVVLGNVDDLGEGKRALVSFRSQIREKKTS